MRHLAASGDPEALLNDLMRTFGDDVWRYACYLTGRRDAADDIAQDVFWKAYRHLASFRGECSVKTWLLRITRRTAFNYMRSAFVRKVTLFGLFAPKTDTAARSAEHIVMDREAERDVWAAVLAMPAKYREVIVLDAHYELSYREMAEVLGISEGTVKSRLHRARAKVEKSLKEVEGE
ncbi:sigma-70 family RNA polymerase sigma factor [Paenibacillus ginsengarvi]|uniref:Sigma-70 family RNA polymerase sigma factor n=2 Tax=Paenibacillus ginsengarvi TaxID=400777 RepID=A0A3B0CBJ9_9BACL|nr:sigma-70 family RNA polymerase sigma factor [Paenibacillus ginsengarvi]RKN82280.1 sigma-70 family RNA polymerase sigma factor [Paenibacillus ginsengarvi]